MAIGDTSEPYGSPSLSDQEIIALYQRHLGRSPDAVELGSERENAMKYSAAGIERQIANRASNAPTSGVRGDEGRAPITIPYVPPPPPPAAPLVIPQSQLGNVLTMGPSALAAGPMPSGPTGLMSPGYGGSVPMSASLGGFDMTTLIILAAVAAAAYLLFLRK